MACRKRSSAPQPSSWAADLCSYRQTRGSQAWSTIAAQSQAERPLARTGYMPLAHPRHPHFSYEEPPLPPGVLQAEASARDVRHGLLSSAPVWQVQCAHKPVLRMMSS